MIFAVRYFRNLVNLLNFSLVCMSWPLHGAKSNDAIVQQLFESGVMKSLRVVEAMKAVDRANYAPHFPYEDRPQSIGFDATISAPHMHATALEHLEPTIMVRSSSCNSCRIGFIVI
jgi:protein-L-isoaspartate(D-aspartate) O-methyltransferase